MLRQLFPVSFLTLVSQLLLHLFILMFAAGFTIDVFAQAPTWRAREGLPVGSQAEGYLRVLQLASKAPLYPWSVRGFTPQAIVDILPETGEHPWQDRMEFNLGPPRGMTVGWIQPRVRFTSNSAYPFGANDGSMWAGKGLTVGLEAGGFLRFGRLHLRLAPEGFWTENGQFDLADNGHTGEAAYWDESIASGIDRPQRFGDESYGRLDWGSSALHLALPGVTVGLSGAGQQWGPALQYPLLLGNNAGGFKHVFVQTGTPLDLWAVRLHGRYVLGQPSQSDFSPDLLEKRNRVVTGAILTLLPRGLDGLELGLGRFIHSLIPEDDFQAQDIFRVFSGVTDDLTNDRERNKVLENQMASVFFRWAFPGAGVEVYAELVKEDFMRDLRHMIEEPDDFMGRVFGFQKVWSRSDGRLTSFRGEMVDARAHHAARFNRLRADGQVPLPLYTHSHVRQGHTHAGQLLSSPVAYGGAGWTLGFDLYHPQGRWTIDLSRSLQTEFSVIHSGTSGPKISDVIYALKLEVVRFGDGIEWTTAVTPSLNLNRNLLKENDVFNLTLRLSMSGLPW